MNTRLLSARVMLVLASFAGAASAQQAGSDANDSAFLKTAIEGNIAEVQMATLAEQRTSGEVQAYADMLMTEHRRALDRTTTLAEEMNVTIPEEPPAEAQSEYTRLTKAPGEEFERQFIDTMVKNHESTIKKYRAYLEKAGSGSDVARYAEETLPVLEKHLQTARSLQQPEDTQAQDRR
jgi:putative membrane protein